MTSSKKVSGTAELKIGARAATVKTATIKFGSVVVTAAAPRPQDVKRNVASGQIALERAAPKIARAGISLKDAKGIPLFHADPKTPGLLIRKLDGRTESGQFVGGRFVVKKA